MGAGHAYHDHAPADYSRAFALGIVLNLGIVVLETVFGLLSGSMALLADAGHNLSDVLGLVVAWVGAAMAKRRASARFTYGLKKGSILAALINALMLMVAVGAISAEAIRRLLDPAPAHAPTMIWVAALAIVINLATAMLFARGRKNDINVRAAYQHMAADAAVSAGVVFAGFVILWTGQAWVDPVMSLAVAGRDLLGHDRAVEGIGRHVADGRAVGDFARRGRSVARAGRRRRGGPRPSRVGAEHDGKCADRASGGAGRVERRAA